MPILTRRSTLRWLALLSSGSLAGLHHSAYSAERPIRVGILSGEDEDIWRVVTDNAQKNGLTIQAIPFLNGDMINAATAAHDLDANAFQHGPFLQAQNEARGYHIIPAGTTYFAPIGLYSQHWSTVSALPDNATIGIPSDPADEARALTLLEQQGLIRLAPHAGSLATSLDIRANPKNIRFRELDDGVLSRSLTDLDAGVIVTEWALKAHIDLKKSLLAREPLANNPYINFIAVNEEDRHASWVPPLVNAFRQPNVRQLLLTIYGGAIVPAWT